MHRRITLLALACACGLSAQAMATTYPLTLTDTAGQTVTIKQEPKRIVVQDGRDILTLALLDRADPFTRLVAWNNLLKKSDGETWKILQSKWPEANNIIDMGFSDKGEINLESVIAKHPDLMVAQLRSKPSLSQTGVLDKLQALNIPVLFIDTMLKPVENTPKSINLLGETLNRESEAKQYTDFYQQHYQSILDKTKTVEPKPLVFIEAKAGLNGLESCCFTHAHVGWGGMIEAIGARNVGSALLPGATGDVSLEKVISMKPDAYIVSGSQWASKTNAAVPFGYGVTQQQVDDAFNRMKQRPGFAQVSAVKDGRFYGIYHNFYNHPYNIVGLEYLAKFIYPNQFKDLDPAKTYSEILSRFTEVPEGKGILGAQAPAGK
ncbi:ABC transporter substrate-binding protein [Serratia proteamaculans]|uniref:ABC transporter substrate-binding protein n=1 Tax=Serratia proteamaculans TaxID=28151 RepID=UPI0015A24DD2|nr:ABC transporter substrate-binding protein [Serratia proteamaculans]NWA70957.1 ABC transporter substrate-binding protein [Serratia proteamaculans]CAI0811690.1 ferrichrome/ferrioxamine B periplasmic transporter [Serratia proteamaculans]CAI0840729.1 ferrichrome/ferrioxamine B periplasmic transporter [Serratia proteamaculans]CAI0844408.1 ferrichrome/ferrioxamine B periplasmic transporter [Serratia proteamaculans]CAI1752484.1 ferrichrome/ferrioxamine B periplasmic transporter [Serratia proteamac